VNIKVSIRRNQGGVKIPMFNAVTTAAFKVTRPAGRPAAGANMESDFLEVYRLKNRGAEFFFFIWRGSTACGEFFIGASGIMADQAINICLRGKIKRIIFPPISCMTAGAPAPVRFNSNSEIIEDIFFAYPLLRPSGRLPGPVIGLVKLSAGLSMTTETGFGDLGAGCKLLVKRLEFGMIGC
jgi:hypothetical protein